MLFGRGGDDGSREFLRREGCLQVQDIFFGKPGPLTSIANLVDDTFLSAEDETEAVLTGDI